VWNIRAIPPLRAQAVGYTLSPEAPYHTGIEVNTSQKGNGTGGSKSSLEDASTQISRGQSGFINFLAGRPGFVESPVLLLPVIFTTAELWASEIPLSHAEASSGHIDLSSKPMQPKPWLLYQYVLSPGIKHTHVYGAGKTLGAILDADYIRTIAIVNVAGVDPFLEWASELVSYHHQPTG
jgi:hypothetical protein